jgi:hypothetical protein
MIGAAGNPFRKSDDVFTKNSNSLHKTGWWSLTRWLFPQDASIVADPVPPSPKDHSRTIRVVWDAAPIGFRFSDFFRHSALGFRA